MRRDASVCPHCRSGSTAWELKEEAWWTNTPEGEDVYLDERSGSWVNPEDHAVPDPSGFYDLVLLESGLSHARPRTGEACRTT